ncbi:MAG: efflux transporter outer membrane subunit [Desulfobacteraceae bacterium]|nr:efflux transporter outer membrane subunit [Desulfobacteraceae bacterium]
MRRKNIVTIVVWGLFLLAQGCLGVKPSPESLVPEQFPDQFVQMPGSGPQVAERWWESFGSDQLNLMVENALGGNFTIREAFARLDQARAISREKRSPLFPKLDLQAGVSQRRTRANGHESTLDTLSLGPAASYEVDLWGGVRSRALAGEFAGRASRLDLETAAMTVAAEVATTWVELVSTVQELDLVKQQFHVNTMLLDLLELRFENALSTGLDILQQQEVVARANAQMPPLEHRINTLTNRLSLLQGRAPVKDLLSDKPDKTGLTELSPLPDVGLPADLLAKRPDVRAAWLRLVAGRWDSKGARADRLPSLNLTGSMVYQNSGLDNLFNSWVLSLAANLAGNLFDGGKRAAAVDKADAVVDERLAFYEKTVFTALVEVEDALSQEIHQRKWLTSLDKELAAARLALGEATNRYQKGLSDFVPLLREQLNVQGLEREIVKQQARLIIARISLHRSLGGTWTETLSPLTAWKPS